MRHLAAPLIEAASECLGEHLPITDVAQVELAIAEVDREQGIPDAATVRAQAYLTSATP